MLITYILLAAGILVGLVTILAFWRKWNNGNRADFDFKTLFIIGLPITVVGITLMVALNNPGMIGLTGLGLFYIVIGIANKDKWK